MHYPLKSRRELPLKTDGRKHTYSERCLMARVAEEFKKKKKDLGAKKAAKELNVSLASFYNYVAGTDLPRMKVLRDASRKWGIKWPWIDTSEVVRAQNVRTPEQLAFSFLDGLREEDVEIVHIGPVGSGMLDVKLRIHFRASGAKIRSK